jgi:hypothetical protein
VPKLEYDLLRRNASTNVRKTDLIERYILHRKPKHTIYVRYFSILLYLLNVFSIIMDSINMTNSPGLVSESCHESTFKLIHHHNFNDVLFSVGATWTFNKYNNIEK